MKRTALLWIVPALLLVAALPASALAEDEGAVEARLAELEARLARLEARLATLEQRLTALLDRAEAKPAAPKALSWTTVESTEHLDRLLAEAKEFRQPVLVLLHAQWCTYGKAYEELLQQEPGLRKAAEDVVLLKIDVTAKDRPDLRKAVGMGAGQPQLVFYDARGKAVLEAALRGWQGEKSKAALQASLDRLEP